MTDTTKPSLTLQVLPPLLLLWPASTTHGPILYLAGGLFALVAFVSLLRIAYLLLHPDRPYPRLLRPALAVAICALALLHAHLSLVAVRTFARETAMHVQNICKMQRGCPMTIKGWQPRRDRYSSQMNYGRWVQWPVLYRSDGKHFEVRLYKAFDMGESWTGSAGN